MKNITILLGLFLVISNFSNAQRIKINSTTTAKHSSFKAEINKFGGMDIENEKNVLRKQRPKNQRFQIVDSTGSGLLIAFKQVFSDVRLKELLPENNIGVNYYLSPDGRILEVSFLLKPNTLVTAAELEALEAAIKNKVKFKLNWTRDNKQEANFVTIAQAVHYNAVLDGTLKN